MTKEQVPKQKRELGEKAIRMGNVVTGIALIAGALFAVPSLVGAAAFDIAGSAPFKQTYREWKEKKKNKQKM